MALTPQVMESITKEGIAAFKVQADAMESAARAGYLKSHAATLDFQRGAEYLKHTIELAKAPQEQHGEELRKLETFKMDLEKKSAAELRGVPTPAIIKRFFKVDDMGDLASYYGRNNLEKIMDAAMRMQTSLDNAYQNRIARQDAKEHNEAVKWIAVAERFGGDIAKTMEQPSLAEFQKQYPTPAEQQRALIMGVKPPRNVGQEQHLRELHLQRDAAYRKALGPGYDEMMKIIKGAGVDGGVRKLNPTNPLELKKPMGAGSGYADPAALGATVANPPSKGVLNMRTGMIEDGTL